jgi:hypothetical protein
LIPLGFVLVGVVISGLGGNGRWWRTGAAHRRGSDHVVTEGFGLPGAEQV